MGKTQRSRGQADRDVRDRALGESTGTSSKAEQAETTDHRLSLGGATALVIGTVVGVGIFNLPSSLAPYGAITLVSLGLTTIGALALGLLFAALSRRMPAPGGPYAYARVAFGNKLGFANAWSYWITCWARNAGWARNAAIAVGWVLYVEVFILGANGVTVFTSLVLMTGITAAIPYGFSAAAQINWRIADQKKMESRRFVRDMIVAVLALVFSILFVVYSRYTGHSFWVYWSPYFMTLAAFLIGLPLYRHQRNRMSDPGGVPPYRE